MSQNAPSGPGVQGEKAPDGTTPEKNKADLNRTFATVEAAGVRIVLVLMVGVFAVYLSGGVAAFIAPERLIGLLGNGVGAFVHEQHTPTGWRWVAMLQYIDMASLGTLLLMAGITFAAYLLVIPSLVRKGETLYLAMVVLQLGLFLLAGWGGMGL